MDVVGLFGEGFEFEGALVVGDGGGQLLESGIDQAAVVVGIGVVLAREYQGAVE